MNKPRRPPGGVIDAATLAKLGTATIAELEWGQIEMSLHQGMQDYTIDQLQHSVIALQKRIQSLELLYMANTDRIRIHRGKREKTQ